MNISITKQDIFKYTVTFVIFLSYLKGGLVNGLLAPALVDFKYMLKTSMKSISLSYTFCNFGYLVGSFFGFAYKYLNREMTFVVMSTIMVLSFAMIPLVTQYWMLYVMTFLTTMGSGAFDCGTYVWIIELWGNKYEPILHTTQMMFGVATILAPVFMTPYVVGDVTKSMNTTMNATTRDAINYAVDRRSKLQIPFLFSAGATFLIPIILVIVFIAKRMENKRISAIAPLTPDAQNELSMAEPTTSEKDKSELSPLTRNILIWLVAFGLNFTTGLEYTHLFFSSVFYQNISIHLSAQRAAEVLSVMSTAFTFGRIFSIIMSMKFKPAVMIVIHIGVISAAVVVLNFGQNSERYIFVGNAMIGFGISALWPLFFAFTEQYIKLTDNVTSIFLIVSMTFPMTTPFVIGPLIEKRNQVFIYAEIVYLTGLIVVTLVSLCIVKAFSFKTFRSFDFVWAEDTTRPKVELKSFAYFEHRIKLKYRTRSQ